MKNKKSKIVILLLLLLFTGLVGYGVYSYYWAKGTFTGTESITIASFNPQTYIENEDFLGNGGEIRLDCSVAGSYNSQYYDGTDNICQGSLQISNNGDTDIVITISDATSNSKFIHGEPGRPEYMGPADNMSVTTNSPSFNWTTKTLAPGESDNLEVEVYAEVSDGFDSSSAIQATEGIYDQSGSSYHDNIQVYVSFKAKAEQVHD